ncbi:T-DNA border endonuclease VirD1 (plasmid) [Roseobacter fucihabitans]|uniref:T-DNA border endonuclease VirD1 n=1 Tax=Roseobacter fucihabitans TaxID=1537242 RepID=A0ABZ2C000_9RHOB|nr:T-DNA border endonuclease subunit VirD1 [Roseobacter litoralis]MBC6967287.1 T-DNA border endonuclease virD1 [Roseobacter litoralis]
MSEETKDKKSWKNRKMIRGRWRDAENEAAVPVRADKVISVKMTEAELAEFDAQILELGLKRNRALRIAARRIGGFVENDAETLEVLRDISRAIAGVATNINQIAKAANRTHDPAYHSFMAERKALGVELSKLNAALAPLMDVSRRRSDGLGRLRKAAGE